jgi:hypothetical protein
MPNLFCKPIVRHSQKGRFEMKKLALLTAIAFIAVSGSAFADPASPEKGCHGYWTTFFKGVGGSRGFQGEAIGGNGNSDGDATNGQAHSDAGRGAILQDFLANNCDVGSQAN